MDGVALAALLWPAATWLAIMMVAQLTSHSGTVATLLSSVTWLVAQVLVARVVLRGIETRDFACAADRVRAVLRSFVGQLLATSAAVAVFSAIEMMRMPDRSPLSWTLLLAMSLGVLFLSLPLAGWQAILAATVATRKQSPSHETTDRALVSLGAWLALPNALVWGWLPFFQANLALAVGPAVLVPALLAAWAGVRLLRRRRWLARVAAGGVRGYRVVDVDGALPEVLPLVADTAQDKRVRVLVATEEASDPYRGQAREEALALVNER